MSDYGMKREHDGDYEDGGRKRPRRHDSDRVDLRVLLQSKNAGAIIGKAGSNIKRLRADYKASVTVPDSSGPERILTISADVGTALDCLRDVIPTLEEYQNMKDEDYQCEIRFLVHQSQAGCVIGRAGFKIKELREKTGTNIKVYSQVCPGSTERVVAVGGKPDSVVNCIHTIYELLETAPPKGPNQYYDPNNFDEFMVADYGGYTMQDGSRGFKGGRGGGGGGGRGGGGFGGRGGGGGMGGRGGRGGRGGGMGDMGGRGGNMGGGGFRGGRGGGGNMDGGNFGGPGPNMGGGRGGNMGNRGGGGMGGMGGGMGGPPSRGGMGRGNFGAQGGTMQGNIGRGGGMGMGGGSGGGPMNQMNQGGGFGGNQGPGAGGFGDGGMGFQEDNMGGMGNQGMMFGNEPVTSTQVTIPKDMAGAIIGKGGTRIMDIRRQSEAQIVIDEALPGSNDRIITITGTEEQIQNAQYLLQMSAKELQTGARAKHQ